MDQDNLQPTLPDCRGSFGPDSWAEPEETMTEESRTLIERAFAKAQESGRADWHKMTVAVLKNRLLDLTERSFRESDYGASTFLEFVRSHDDILELDTTATPPLATLKGATSPSLPT